MLTEYILKILVPPPRATRSNRHLWNSVCDYIQPIPLAICILAMCGGVSIRAQTRSIVQRWEVNLPMGGIPITGADGELYLSVQNRLVKLDSQTGAKKWSFFAGSALNGYVSGLATTPNPNGRIFVTTWKANYALDGRNGEVIWENSSPEDGNGYGFSPLLGTNGLVYFSVASSGKVKAADTDSGETRWTFSGGKNGMSPPIISGQDVIYFSSINGQLFTTVHALDARTGRAKWEFKLPGQVGVQNQLAVNSDETVFLAADKEILYAIDGNTGEMKWLYFTEDRDAFLLGPIIDPEGSVIIGNFSKLYAVDGRSGTLKWSQQINSALAHKPAVSPDGTVFYVTYDSNGITNLLHALDVQHGVELFSYPFPGYHGMSQFGPDGSIYASYSLSNSSKLIGWIGGRIPHVTATATGQIFNGFLTGAKVTNPGAGYTNIPNITVTGGGGTGAVLTARILDGVVIGFDVQYAGRGYTSVPSIVIDPPIRFPVPSTAVATVSKGVVTGITLIEPGYGYAVTPPSIQFFGGGGSGAAAAAIVQNGSLVQIHVTQGGGGYTSAPVVVIAPPAGLPSVSVAVNRVEITLQMTPGYFYKLQTSFDGHVWVDAGTSFLAVDSTSTQVFDVTSGATFYRLVEGP